MTDVPAWLPAYLEAADGHAQADGSAIGTGISEHAPRRVSVTVEAVGYLRAAADDQDLQLVSRTRLDADLHPKGRPRDAVALSVCWWPARALIGAYATTLVSWDAHLETTGQLPGGIRSGRPSALSLTDLVSAAHHIDSLPAGEARAAYPGRNGQPAWPALVTALTGEFPASLTGDFGTLPAVAGTAATAAGLIGDTLNPNSRVWIRTDENSIYLREWAVRALERAHLVRQARLLAEDTRSVTLPSATRPPVLFRRTP
jgi:hypothetical protein